MALGRRVLGQELARRAKPARRDGGSPWGSVARRGGQQFDRALVTAHRGALDVPGTPRRWSAAFGKRLAGAGMRPDSPGRAAAVVHRPPDDRVTEAQPARQRRRLHQVECGRLVQRAERDALRDLGDGCRDGRVEGVADHRGGAQHQAGVLRQVRELLLLDGHADAQGHAAPGLAVVRPRSGALRVRELLEVERVAAAVAVDALAHVEVADQRLRLGRGQRGQFEIHEHAFPGGRRERDEQLAGRGGRAQREHEHDARRRGAAKQVRDELDGCRVRPLQIVEHDHERALGRDLRDERADRVVQPVALHLQLRMLGIVARAVEAGKQQLQLRLQPGWEAIEHWPREGRERRIERCDRHGERHVLLDLRGAAGDRPKAALLGERDRLTREARLAVPGLAADCEPGTAPGDEIAQGAVERGQLIVAANERSTSPGRRSGDTASHRPPGGCMRNDKGYRPGGPRVLAGLLRGQPCGAQRRQSATGRRPPHKGRRGEQNRLTCSPEPSRIATDHGEATPSSRGYCGIDHCGRCSACNCSASEGTLRVMRSVASQRMGSKAQPGDGVVGAPGQSRAHRLRLRPRCAVGRRVGGRRTRRHDRARPAAGRAGRGPRHQLRRVRRSAHAGGPRGPRAYARTSGRGLPVRHGARSRSSRERPPAAAVTPPPSPTSSSLTRRPACFSPVPASSAR